MQFIRGFEAVLPTWITNPPVWLVTDLRNALAQGVGIENIPHVLGIPFCVNLPACAIVAIITAILIKGTKDSTRMAAIMVVVKLGVIALFVLAGAFYVRPENWVPFAPNGMSGIFMGAFIIFFAYIGFDALATAAEECKNPQRDLPIGIIGSLLVTTVVYVLVALVMTGVIKTNAGAVPQEFLKAPMAYVMEMVGQNWIAGLISVGALTGLTSVLLVMQLAATRILFSMARDNFFPSILKKVHPTYKTPHIITWVVGIAMVIGCLFLDLNLAAQLCIFSVFTSFIIVCIGVMIFRKTDPNRHRPFKVPFSPLFPSLGVLLCGGLMIVAIMSMGKTALLFPLWLNVQPTTDP
jgi:APA family basic amino acid/polyamine antiporter